MLERMVEAGINGALSVILLAIIVVPAFLIFNFIKKKFEEKNFIQESDEEADEFIRKLKEKIRKNNFKKINIL